MTALIPILGALHLSSACSQERSSGASGGGGGTEGNPGPGAASAGSGTVASSAPFAACGAALFDSESGALNAAEYGRQARLWDRSTIDCRLGPRFVADETSAALELPTAFEPAHQTSMGGYLCPTYELRGTCAAGCDYGSTAGQVLYAPAISTEPGVERIQNYAYEKGVICESLQTGGWLGGPRPDPGLTLWSEKRGRPALLPNGFSQTEFWQTNAGILIFPDGLLGATGNQTAGDSKPYLELPTHKVPTAVALSSYNEFAFVTLWDTERLRGEVAVLALRADMPQAFSIPYFALPNEAGFKAIHLMGYVELPDMQTPTAIAVSGDNANTPGGHVPGFEYGNATDPDKNILTSEAARLALAREDYERRVAMAGQLVVASRWEDKVTFVDLRPLAQFVRGVYFGSDADKRRAAGAKDVWPFTFERSPEARPVVVTTLSVPHPTVVRVGNQASDNEQGLRKPLKAWVGNLKGEVRVYDLSAFLHDAPRPIPPASVRELAKVQVGRNLTSMVRQGSHAVLVVSRQDRHIDWVGISEDAPESLRVLRTLRDSRIADPVWADPSDRGPVLTVADFGAEKLLNYRFGATENNAGKPPAAYGCGPGGADSDCSDFEFGGELGLPGAPFFVGTSNVN